MVEYGLFKRFSRDAIFGLHNWPGMPVGHVGIRPGPILASSNTFEIIITGKSDHATLRGTVWTFSVEMIDLIETRMKASHYTQLPIPHGLHEGDRDSDIM